MSIDVNRVGTLLHICDLSKQWPKLQGLHDAAMVELTKLAEDAKAELAKAAKALADKVQADAQAKADAEAKAQAPKPVSVPKTIPAQTFIAPTDPVVDNPPAEPVERRV